MAKTQLTGLRNKNGIWHIEKRVKDYKNGWLRESTGITVSKRHQAEKYLLRRLSEIEVEIQRQQEGVYLFTDAAFRYLKEISHKTSASTMASHLDQIIPFIGKLTLENVHDSTLSNFIQHEKDRGQSPKSINNALGVISAILHRSAERWRNEQGKPWLQYAPPKITRLPVKGKQKLPYTLSWDEQDAFLKELPSHTADAVLFDLNTSLRESELTQLRWDWEFTVNGYSVFILPEVVTKNDEERIVVCNSIAQSILEKRRGIHTTHVFTYDGNPIKSLNTKAWSKAWVRSGLPTDGKFLKGIHNIRHTCGRRLRAAGVQLETRKVILGHKNDDITTHYSQVEIEEIHKALELLANRKKASPALRIVGKVSDIKKQLKVA